MILAWFYKRDCLSLKLSLYSKCIRHTENGLLKLTMNNVKIKKGGGGLQPPTHCRSMKVNVDCLTTSLLAIAIISKLLCLLEEECFDTHIMMLFL